MLGGENGVVVVGEGEYNEMLEEEKVGEEKMNVRERRGKCGAPI